MEEEMDRTGDTNLEENFDELFEEPEDQDTNGAGEDGQEPEAEALAEEEPKYKVNFLGEEKELPVSELVTAAQKGMNYDHVKKELESLKAIASERESAYQVMEQMAKTSGMTMEQYLNVCRNTLEESRIRTQVEKGVPEEVAKRLLELEEKETLREEAERAQKAEAQKQEAYADLLREYPELTSLPDEVAAAVAGGETPLNAYRAYELKQVKHRLAVLEKANENKNRSVGSVQGDSPEEVDDFLAGFDSV